MNTAQVWITRCPGKREALVPMAVATATATRSAVVLRGSADNVVAALHRRFRSLRNGDHRPRSRLAMTACSTTAGIDYVWLFAPDWP